MEEKATREKKEPVSKQRNEQNEQKKEDKAEAVENNAAANKEMSIMSKIKSIFN